MKEILSDKRVKITILALVIITALFVRGINMFNYPAYREDEGTYVSQAWAVETQGELAPYTYWYDHPPAGWTFMAGFFKIAGYFAFGVTANAGRVFTLLIVIASTLLVFRITYRITGRFLPAIIAVLLYTLSPLGIEHQRRVLLDNIMLFWLLLSMSFLIKKEVTLLDSINSALSFALAALSKETVLIFFPAFLWASYALTHVRMRKFALPLWLFTATLIILLYPLMAVLKEELMPTGMILGGSHPHVSLYEAIRFQLSRPATPDSNFFFNLTNRWIIIDPIIIAIGTAATALNLFIFRKDPRRLFLAIISLIFIAYLAHPGIILDWYIIPQLAFFAINISMLFAEYLRQTNPTRPATHALALLPILLFVPIILQFRRAIPYLYTSKQTNNQVAAINWIKENVSGMAAIIIDNYAYTDLHAARYSVDTIYPDAQYYSKAQLDPEIRQFRFNDDWRNVDYLLFTEAVQKTMRDQNMDFITEAYDNSTLKIRFDENVGLETPYWVEIREVTNNRKELKFSWDWYAREFITANGRVVDKSVSNKRTTSEGQSYAMLRAVWINDRETFDRVWNWTKENLSKTNGLFSWLYENDSQDLGRIIDPASAADADQDIALALLFASKRWDSDSYLLEARTIMDSIWKYETAVVDNFRFLTAGDWVRLTEGAYIINPSYFAPYAYRIFASADPAHDWEGLVTSSYDLLNRTSSGLISNDQRQFYPTDWAAVTPEGDVVEPPLSARVPTSGVFSYDATRVLWRISLDYQWFVDRQALDYLLKMNYWPALWEKDPIIYASYTTDGRPISQTESLANYANLLAFFSFVKPEFADEVLNQKIMHVYSESGKQYYWGDRTNYYDQNWVWFGLGLYNEALPNLWQ